MVIEPVFVMVAVLARLTPVLKPTMLPALLRLPPLWSKTPV